MSSQFLDNIGSNILWISNYLSQKYKESGNTTPYISVYYTPLILYYVEEKFCIINNNIFTENIVDLIN